MKVTIDYLPWGYNCRIVDEVCKCNYWWIGRQDGNDKLFLIDYLYKGHKIAVFKIKMK